MFLMQPLLRGVVALALVALVGVITSFGEEGKPKVAERKVYTSKEFDFTLDITDFGETVGMKQVIALQASAPEPVGGFAPSVNVIVQMQKTTPAAYLEKTKLELVGAKLTLVEGKEITHAGKPAIWVEYTGKMASREMHWYCVAVCLDDRVILATGTAAEKGFDQVSEKLKAAVLSLNLVH